MMEAIRLSSLGYGPRPQPRPTDSVRNLAHGAAA
ncbi:unnamed protein product [Fusarium graminearum]|uniref:Uncharacterized protein n=1 Tax=Gibberella zeae TaxID=5518 RepID=A0A4E9DRT3_GIBZA|nr:unnamed protein product [Fusarium graminearum]CAG1982049.1 unnamed protein product [Fusarium graminearum]CAG2009409.1 unnamed protein product [Fusarium graminearum]